MLKTKLLFLCLFLWSNVLFAVTTIPVTSPVTQRPDPPCSAVTSECDLGYDSDAKKIHYLKLKRLAYISLGKWNGREFINVANPDVPTDNQGADFCITSFNEDIYDVSDPKKSRGTRVYTDFSMSLTSTNTSTNGLFLVNTSSSSAKPIPVKLTLKGTEKNTILSNDIELFNNWSGEIPNSSITNSGTCNSNSLVIEAVVESSAIIASGATGDFRGTFKITATYVDLKVEHNFDVTLSVSPVLQISGLSDISVGFDGTDIDKKMNFCVFVFGGTGFKIKGDSQNGSNGSFLLQLGSDTIPYILSVGTSSDDSLIPLTNNYSSISPTSTVPKLCKGRQGNMQIRLRIDASNVQGTSSGVYKDTVTLTVAPQ